MTEIETHLAKSCRIGVENEVSIDGDLGHLGHDPQLANKILKKRRDEMARRMRLLDPRQRVGGVPHEVIKTQMAVKQAAIDAEQAEDAFYAQSAELQDQILQAVESMKATRARERQMEVVDYSLANLRKEQRREYELSDPDALKKYVLPDPDDPANPLGPSSMLKFSSEGKQNPELKRQGREAMASWLAAQVQEKQDREAHEKELDRMHDDRAMLAAHVRGVCEDNEIKEQQDAKCEEAAENVRLAQLALERKKAKKAADDAWKQRHIDSVVNSERMTESCDSKVGITGRFLKAEYKRLSLEEEQDVYNSNARQLINKWSTKQALKEEEAAEAARINCSVAVLAALEEERARQQQERRMRIIEENKKLAAAKREADKDERKEYFKYDP
ncbi:unnamed protein product [Durusdinium trenchii]|uniref:Uncharacterized protein n=2 Tax=Durusdinium trenchii TaxID=1381693 RepID=A0ABP0RSC9_9DINO